MTRLRTSFEVEGLPSSARFEIEPLIGETSPCFADEGGAASRRRAKQAQGLGGMVVQTISPIAYPAA